MEDLLLSGMVKDRSCYEVFKESGHTLTDLGKSVWTVLDDIYTRDACLTSIPRDLLEASIQSRAQNPKHAQLYLKLVEKAYLGQVSVTNIIALIKEAKTNLLAIELANASQKRDHKQVEKVLAKLRELETVQGEDEELVSITKGTDISDLIERRLNQDNLIKVGTPMLTEWLGGGILGGHHIISYARPEAGKTTFGITCGQGFLKQGLNGIYLMNEDRRDDIELRFIQAALEKPASFLKDKANSEWVRAKLEKMGYYDNVLYADCNPGSLVDIRRMFKKYKPKWFICDQLRNLDPGKSESNTGRLDTVARSLRDLLKEFDVAGVSLTQAGDSASGKAVLDMSDVDSSKTGIPAACDVLIGMGVTNELQAVGQRCLSIVKNKMPEGKGHGQFNVAFHQQISKLKDPT